MRRRVLVLAALLATLPAPAAAQQADVMNSGRRTMTAERMRDDERIELDGVLDEPVWDRAQHGGEFIMQDPVLGRHAHRTHRGPHRLQPGPPLHRRHALRLRARQAQGQHPQARRVPERRRPVHVDDGHVPEPADRLLLRDEPVGPDGRRAEGPERHQQPRVGRHLERPRRAGARSAGCWRSTCRSAPWPSIPNAPAWGINFQRTVRRKNEELLWTGHQRNQGLQRMANAGLLLGLTDVTQGRASSCKPYLAGHVADAPGRVPEIGERHLGATSAST